MLLTPCVSWAPLSTGGEGMRRPFSIPPLYSGGARGGSWATVVVSTNHKKPLSSLPLAWLQVC